LDGSAAPDLFRISVETRTNSAIPHLSIPVGTNLDSVYELERSSNLVAWAHAGTFLEGVTSYSVNI
jgi:hypothetical protein